MYEKNDKRRLYWLIDQYLAKRISGSAFCDEYYYCYGLEIRTEDLTRTEQASFSELDKIAGRFTDVKEDLEKYPGTYYDEQQLLNKIVETKKKLNENRKL